MGDFWPPLLLRAARFLNRCGYNLIDAPRVTIAHRPALQTAAIMGKKNDLAALVIQYALALVVHDEFVKLQRDDLHIHKTATWTGDVDSSFCNIIHYCVQMRNDRNQL